MAKLVTVYEARPSDVARIVGFLERRHLHPVVADDIDRMGTYRDQAHTVQIAVPATERDMAIGVLTELERQDEVRLAHLTKVTNAAVLFVIVVLAFVAIVGVLDAEGKWFAATWAILCAIAAVALIRWAWARKPEK
jgi:hypothetical protein